MKQLQISILFSVFILNFPSDYKGCLTAEEHINIYLPYFHSNVMQDFSIKKRDKKCGRESRTKKKYHQSLII